jgi:hypothetical protein
MKIDNKCHLKYLLFIFLCLLMNSCFSIRTSTSNQNEMREKKFLLKTLQNEVDNLIDMLNNQKPLMYSVNSKSNQFYNSPANSNLKEIDNLVNLNHQKNLFNDEVLKSFQMLNNDFLNFEKMLNETNLEHQRQDELEQELLKNEQIVPKPSSSYSYYEFVKNKNKIVRDIKNHIKFIKEIKKRKYPDTNKIKNAHKKLSDLNSVYNQYNKEIQKKYLIQVKLFKNIASQTLSANEDIQKLFAIVDKVMLAKEKFNEQTESIQTLKKISNRYQEFINKFSFNEERVNLIKKNAFKKIKKIFSDENLRVHKKVSKVFHLDKTVEKCTVEKKRILIEKRNIIEHLRNITIKNLKDIENLIIQREIKISKSKVRIDHNKRLLGVAEKVNRVKDKLKEIKKKTEVRIDHNKKLFDVAEKLNKVNKLKEIKKKTEMKIDHNKRLLGVAEKVNRVKDKLKEIKKKTEVRIDHNKKLFDVTEKVNNIKKLKEFKKKTEMKIDHNKRLLGVAEKVNKVKDKLML